MSITSKCLDFKAAVATFAAAHPEMSFPTLDSFMKKLTTAAAGGAFNYSGDADSQAALFNAVKAATVKTAGGYRWK
jgi:hypothetical protein